jgi:hypothetical protein
MNAISTLSFSNPKEQPSKLNKKNKNWRYRYTLSADPVASILRIRIER